MGQGEDRANMLVQAVMLRIQLEMQSADLRWGQPYVVLVVTEGAICGTG